MSPLRAAARPLARPAGRRLLSTTAVCRDDHHHSHTPAADNVEYPPENFFNPFWAKAVLVTALVTRWIKSMTTPSEYWAVQNNAHTQLSINMAQVEIEKAVAPPTMRPYRSVQLLYHGSPHSMPIDSKMRM
ncbi:hypothetical protein DL96DRAFT_1603155 [Flagelloscypha sp. PMI_526]|nr:hypothetical protein DL96DRAFT_1603155 [Flagelloscypha sp. PMI_526]